MGKVEARSHAAGGKFATNWVKARGAMASGLMRLEQLLYYVAMGSIMFIMLLTTADVAGRYFANRPILGAVQLQENLLAVIVFLSMAAGQRRHVHVGVDLIETYLKGRLLHGVRCFNLFAVLVLFGFVTVGSFRVFLGDLAAGTYAGGILHIPRAPFIFSLPLGSFLLLLRLVAQLKQEVQGIFGGR